MKNEVTVQIYAGGYKAEAAGFELVKQKLLLAIDSLPVTKVLMGWPPDTALYEKTANLLSKKNIDLFLWFSVFSETGALKPLDLLTDFCGRALERNGEEQNEDFFFCCPKNGGNIEKILDIFTEKFSPVKECFKGVFLDKIRYPSFANSHAGRGVYSCFCPECLAYYKDKKFDAETFRQKIKNKQSIDILEYCGSGKYIFSDELFKEFFDLKASIIYDSLKKICGFFKDLKYSIGFDVFAPFLAPFTGQDIVRLSSLCDFIKPMMYRVTNAPAGLPFETDLLLKYTGNNIIKNSLFLDSCVKEIKNLSEISSCPVYTGIEINRVDDVAPADPYYVEETIAAYLKEGIHKFALSWNLLDMPDDNIAKTSDMLR